MTDSVRRDVVGAQTLTGVTGVDLQGEDDVRNWLPMDVLEPPIRNSNLSTLFTCLRMYLLKERCALEPWGYRSAAETGTMTHLVLNALWKGESKNSVHNLLSLYVADAKEDARGWYENHGTPDVCDRVLKQIDQDAALALCMGFLHWEKYPLNPAGCKPVLLEEELTLRLPDILQPIQGRLDLVVEVPSNNPLLPGLVIVDHKTTDYPKALGLSMEFSTWARLYRLLLQNHWPGRPVTGAVLNVIQKPDIRLKEWQTFDEYLEECRDWYEARDDAVGFCGSDGNPVLFKSGPRKGLLKPRWEHADKADLRLAEPPMRSFPHRFTEPLMPPSLKNMLLVANRAARCAPLLSNFPETGEPCGHCRSRYNKPCPYLPLCSTNPVNWPTIVEQQFTIRLDKPDTPEDLEQETSDE